MSYEITYRRKLVKTANPNYWLFIEETGSNNCWTYNSTTGREVRTRNTYVTLIDFKDNVRLNMWEKTVRDYQEQNPEDNILKWDPKWWLSWKSKCKTVQATINLFKEKSYKPIWDIVSVNKLEDFLKELPNEHWYLKPEVIDREVGRAKCIDEYIFRTFNKTKRVVKEIDPKNKVWNIQINWNNLVKFTRNWYRHSYTKNYPFTEEQMKRLKKKIEDKWYKDVLIEKENLVG